MSTALFQILAILREGPSDSASVRDRLREMGGPESVPSLPAFYRYLRRAVDEGWIDIVGSEAPEDGIGRPRQLYDLTGPGLAVLTAHAHRLERFTRLAVEGPADAEGC